MTSAEVNDVSMDRLLLVIKCFSDTIFDCNSVDWVRDAPIPILANSNSNSRIGIDRIGWNWNWNWQELTRIGIGIDLELKLTGIDKN
jgi:hypothetical protein